MIASIIINSSNVDLNGTSLSPNTNPIVIKKGQQLAKYIIVIKNLLRYFLNDVIIILLVFVSVKDLPAVLVIQKLCTMASGGRKVTTVPGATPSEAR